MKVLVVIEHIMCMHLLILQKVPVLQNYLFLDKP